MSGSSRAAFSAGGASNHETHDGSFFAEEHGTNKAAVIYCGTEECDLSAELATRLRNEVGWNDVRILEGGFLGWRRKQP